MDETHNLRTAKHILHSYSIPINDSIRGFPKSLHKYPLEPGTNWDQTLLHAQRYLSYLYLSY